MTYRLTIALVDQDGPLADFDGAFHRLCDEQGWERHSTPETQCHRFATDCILDPEAAKEARRWVDSHPRWFHDLEPVPGAIDGINDLAKHADVWICTKPLEANVTCRDGKAEWVRTHLGADWEQRLIITPDKSKVRGAVLLDDAPKRAWFPNAEWLPVIFPMPWNGPDSEWSDLLRWTWGDDPRWLASRSRPRFMP